MANPSPAPEVLAKLAEVQAAGERAGGYLLERDVWFSALRDALTALAAAQKELDRAERFPNKPVGDMSGEERYRLLAAAVNESHQMCDDECDSFAHSDACAQRNHEWPAQEIIQLRAQLAAATREAETLAAYVRELFYEYGVVCASSSAVIPDRADKKRVLEDALERALAPRSPEGARPDKEGT